MYYKRQRIQEDQKFKSTSNVVLIADSESTQKTVQTRTGIIDLGAFCVELWPFYCSKRISVPMSYIKLSIMTGSVRHFVCASHQGKKCSLIP